MGVPSVLPERRRHLLVLLLGSVIVGSTVLSPLQVTQRLSTLDPVVFTLAITVAYVIRPAIAFPLSLLTLVVGFRFGLFPGLPIAFTGTLLTCYIPYLATREYTPDGFLHRIRAKSRHIVTDLGSIRSVAAARLSPAPSDVVSIGAGMAAVPSRDYLIGTFFGEIPWTVFYVLSGQAMGRLTMPNEGSLPTLLIITTLIAVMLIAVSEQHYFRKTTGDK